MSADCNCGLVDQLVKDVADVLRELIAYDVRMVRVVVRRRSKRVYRRSKLQRGMSEKEHRTNSLSGERTIPAPSLAESSLSGRALMSLINAGPQATTIHLSSIATLKTES